MYTEIQALERSNLHLNRENQPVDLVLGNTDLLTYMFNTIKNENAYFPFLNPLSHISLVCHLWHKCSEVALKKIKQQYECLQQQDKSCLEQATLAELVTSILIKKFQLANLSKFNVKARQVEILLEKAPALKHLIIKSRNIEAITEKYQALETLIVSESINLKKFPDFLNVSVLITKNCLQLQSLLFLPNALFLDMAYSSCIQLEQAPLLEKLNCKGCRNLALPKDLPSLISLNCEFSQFKALPFMPNVKYIEHSHCNFSKELVQKYHL